MTPDDALPIRLGRILGSPIESLTALPRGSTGPVLSAVLADGRRVVVKVACDQGPPPALEARLLGHLAEADAFPVPAVRHVDDEILVLDWIDHDAGRPTPQAQADAGARLAALHRHTGRDCGWPEDTHIGRVRQDNRPAGGWIAFFRDRRLLPLTRACRAAGRLSDETAGDIERLAGRLERYLDEPDQPALLHGDVWQGNVLTRGDRVVGLIDPALAYGHPEFDLSTPWVYGGLDTAFLRAYAAAADLPGDFLTVRRPIYALWPLLVNALYWDAGYAKPAAAIARRFAA